MKGLLMTTVRRAGLLPLRMDLEAIGLTAVPVGMKSFECQPNNLHISTLISAGSLHSEDINLETL